MVSLTPPERDRVQAAIAEAERKTSCEFVCVIARRADRYLFVPALAAAALVLALPAAIRQEFWVDWRQLYLAQIAVFFVAFFILQWPPLAARLVPRRIRAARARRLAREQFFLQGLAQTRERTGVLLFLALDEHHVEVIGDSTVHAKLGEAAWDEIVQAFLHAVKGGRVADGMVAALATLGDRLGQAFPRRPDDRNEIADRLVEI